MSYEKDIASNVKSNPKIFWSYAKRKTIYKQGISYLHIGDCNAEGKRILTTSDLEEVQVLSNFFKSVYTVENPTNIPPMCMRYHTSITTLDINKKMVHKKLTNLNISSHQDMTVYVYADRKNVLTV